MYHGDGDHHGGQIGGDVDLQRDTGLYQVISVIDAILLLCSIFTYDSCLLSTCGSESIERSLK